MKHDKFGTDDGDWFANKIVTEFLSNKDIEDILEIYIKVQFLPIVLMKQFVIFLRNQFWKKMVWWIIKSTYKKNNDIHCSTKMTIQVSI